jgi:hypothetical protein
MKVVILYRPNSEHGRMIEDFVHEYQSRNQDAKLELLNIDTKDGYATAKLYDVVDYPAILVLQDNGSVQNMWQGKTLPLIDEVSNSVRA